MRKILVTLILAAFLANTLVPPAFAQVLYQGLDLPRPGVMVKVSPAFVPPILKGINVDIKRPFNFDFILDTGNSSLNDDGLKDEANKLIRYFLASLTIPDKDLWVNLSPYEKDRIIADDFSLTEMGRDMLTQDYFLKQITASLIYPESDSGKAFWQQVYAKAFALFGTTDIPVDTFNKVWIVPNDAEIYEDGTKAFVTRATLKVMLETDYLATSNDPLPSGDDRTPTIAKDILREVVIPILEKEVNEGANFNQLRQIYYSLILAKWYKETLKDSILNRKYSDRNKVSGVDLAGAQDKENIYAQYLEAFKKGVFNYVKEEQAINSQELIPRKYFSGGLDFAQKIRLTRGDDASQVFVAGRGLEVRGDFVEALSNADASQGKTFYPSDTSLGRNSYVDPIIRRWVDIISRSKEGLVHVGHFGPGFGAITVLESMRALKDLKQKIKYSVVELPAMVPKAYLTSASLTDEFRQVILGGEEGFKLLNLILVKDQDDLISSAIIEIDNGKSANSVYRTFAVAADVEYMRLGVKQTNSQKRAALFARIVKSFEGKTDKVVQEDPLKSVLDQEGADLIATENLAATGKKFDVLTASNVTMLMRPLERRRFLDSMRDALLPGGVLIIKNRADDGDKDLGWVYQKTAEGQLVLIDQGWAPSTMSVAPERAWGLDKALFRAMSNTKDVAWWRHITKGEEGAVDQWGQLGFVEQDGAAFLLSLRKDLALEARRVNTCTAIGVKAVGSDGRNILGLSHVLQRNGVDARKSYALIKESLIGLKSAGAKDIHLFVLYDASNPSRSYVSQTYMPEADELLSELQGIVPDVTLTVLGRKILSSNGPLKLRDLTSADIKIDLEGIKVFHSDAPDQPVLINWADKAEGIFYASDKAELTAAIEEQRILRSFAPAVTLPSHGGPLGFDQMGTSLALLSAFLEDRFDEAGDEKNEIGVFVGRANQANNKFHELYQDYLFHLQGLLDIEEASWLDLQVRKDEVSVKTESYLKWIEQLSQELPFFIQLAAEAKLLFGVEDYRRPYLQEIQEQMERFLDFYMPVFKEYLAFDETDKQSWPEIDISSLILEFNGVRDNVPDPVTGFVLKTKADDYFRDKLAVSLLPNLDFITRESGYKVKVDPRILMFILERMEENARGFFNDVLNNMDRESQRLSDDPEKRLLGKEDLRVTYRLEKGVEGVVRIKISNPGIMGEELLAQAPLVDFPAAFFWKKVRTNQTSGGTSLPAIWHLVGLLGGSVEYRNVVIDGIKSVEAIIELPAADKAQASMPEQMISQGKELFAQGNIGAAENLFKGVSHVTTDTRAIKRAANFLARVEEIKDGQKWPVALLKDIISEPIKEDLLGLWGESGDWERVYNRIRRGGVTKEVFNDFMDALSKVIPSEPRAAEIMRDNMFLLLAEVILSSKEVVKGELRKAAKQQVVRLVRDSRALEVRPASIIEVPVSMADFKADMKAVAVDIAKRLKQIDIDKKTDVNTTFLQVEAFLKFLHEDKRAGGFLVSPDKNGVYPQSSFHLSTGMQLFLAEYDKRATKERTRVTKLMAVLFLYASLYADRDDQDMNIVRDAHEIFMSEKEERGISSDELFRTVQLFSQHLLAATIDKEKVSRMFTKAGILQSDFAERSMEEDKLVQGKKILGAGDLEEGIRLFTEVAAMTKDEAVKDRAIRLLRKSNDIRDLQARGANVARKTMIAEPLVEDMYDLFFDPEAGPQHVVVVLERGGVSLADFNTLVDRLFEEMIARDLEFGKLGAKPSIWLDVASFLADVAFSSSQKLSRGIKLDAEEREKEVNSKAGNAVESLARFSASLDKAFTGGEKNIDRVVSEVKGHMDAIDIENVDKDKMLKALEAFMSFLDVDRVEVGFTHAKTGSAGTYKSLTPIVVGLARLFEQYAQQKDVIGANRLLAALLIYIDRQEEVNNEMVLEIAYILGDEAYGAHMRVGDFMARVLEFSAHMMGIDINRENVIARMVAAGYKESDFAEAPVIPLFNPLGMSDNDIIPELKKQLPVHGPSVLTMSGLRNFYKASFLITDALARGLFEYMYGKAVYGVQLNKYLTAFEEGFRNAVLYVNKDKEDPRITLKWGNAAGKFWIEIIDEGAPFLLGKKEAPFLGANPLLNGAGLGVKNFMWPYLSSESKQVDANGEIVIGYPVGKGKAIKLEFPDESLSQKENEGGERFIKDPETGKGIVNLKYYQTIIDEANVRLAKSTASGVSLEIEQTSNDAWLFIKIKEGESVIGALDCIVQKDGGNLEARRIYLQPDYQNVKERKIGQNIIRSLNEALGSYKDGVLDMRGPFDTVKSSKNPFGDVEQGRKMLEALVEKKLAVQTGPDEYRMLPAAVAPGGIDFNSGRIDLTRTGQRSEFDWGADGVDLENIEINGLVPVIIGMTPVNDLAAIFPATK